MTYIRIYKVNDQCHTRFIREVDYGSAIGQAYLAKAEKAVESNKQKHTLCVYVREEMK